MAIATPTSLSNNFNTAPTNAQWVSAAGVTFTTGRLYLFGYMIDRAAGAPDLSTGFSVTHGATSRTYTHVVQSQTWVATRSLALYRYVAVATETAVMTFSPPGTASNCCAGGILEIASGFDSTNPVVQSKSGSAASGLSVSATYAATPTTGNLLVTYAASRAVSSANTLNPRTNWTELFENLGSGTAGTSGGLEAQYTASLEMTTSCSVASSNRTWGIVSAEIASSTLPTIKRMPALGVG